MADLNRIKVVLVEKGRTNKWRADQMSKNQATISKWCTNSTQPSLETLVDMACIIGVNVRELMMPTDTQKETMSLL